MTSLVISMMRVTNAHPEDIDVELEHLARLKALHGEQQARIDSIHSESTHDFHQK